MSSIASLPSRRDFQRVYREGTRARRDGLTVWVASGPAAAPRLGLTVRKEVAGGVRRNRIRRRLREAIRRVDPSGPSDIVVRAETPALAWMDFQELVNHLDAALAVAGGRA